MLTILKPNFNYAYHVKLQITSKPVLKKKEINGDSKLILKITVKKIILFLTIN